MADDDNVLFVRSNSNASKDSDDGQSSEDVWDDSALIKAYDKAVNSVKEEVTKRIELETQNKGATQKKPQPKKQNQTQKSQKKWCVGSPCRAVYSEDGELYEAVITKISENLGTCTVKFIGYNNKEKVELSSLLESEGLQSQINQQKEALGLASNSMEFEEVPKQNSRLENSKNCETNKAKAFKNMYIPECTFGAPIGAMPPAPPLPPQLMARLPENDADALSSMLMSWYMNGFHTGYYLGLKQAQTNPQHGKK